MEFQGKQPNEKELVAKGAKLMDKILPGWYKMVDTDNLSMGSSYMCLLGQTFGVHAEKCLAREMYPEDWEAVLTKAKNSGWANSGAQGYHIAADAGGMIKRLIKRIRGDRTIAAEFNALAHVCRGHDNKCEWIDEIAARLAQDELAAEAPVTHDETGSTTT